MTQLVRGVEAKKREKASNFVHEAIPRSALTGGDEMWIFDPGAAGSTDVDRRVVQPPDQKERIAKRCGALLGFVTWSRDR
jgi:hypothetical protein